MRKGRRILRGLASLGVLVILLAGVPGLLTLATERIEWARLWRLSFLLGPDDGTAALAIVVVLGWASWVVFTACVAAECVRLISRQRIRIRMPGLAGPQSWAAGLLISVATMVAGPLSPPAEASVPVAHVATALADPAAPHPAGVREATRAPEPHPATAPGLIGGLLAAALIARVTEGRASQLAGRPVGRRIRHPTGEAHALEVTMRRTQDPAAMQRLQLALAVIGAHAYARGSPMPPLKYVLVRHEELEFHFRRVPGAPPRGFRILDRQWVLPAEAELPIPSRAVYPWPALVGVGITAQRHQVMVDLEAYETIGVEAPADRARDQMLTLATELCSMPWGTDTEIVLVSGRDSSVRGLPPRVSSEFSLDSALNQFEGFARERARANVAYRRLDPAAGETWRTRVLVIDAPLDDTQRRRLVDLDCGRESGLVVIGATDVGAPGLRFTPDGRVTGPGLPQLVAQPLDQSTRTSLDNLHATSADASTTPAPWWDRAGESPGAPDLRSGLWAHPPAPQVLLLGPIELRGARGERPTRAVRQCIEYAGWLLENPGATAVMMADALAVAEGTRRSNMSRLRTWLGRDPNGEPYLPEAYSGRIWLHPDVSSDWQQLRLLTVAGVKRAGEPALITALELVRGAPLADAAPTQWHWAEEMRIDISSMIRDIGVVLSDMALARNHIDLARWAAARALSAAPEDELLLCARVRTEHQAGNPAEVRRLAMRLTQHARVLNIDLADETVVLLQQVMEGRPRPRRAQAPPTPQMYGKVDRGR